MIVCRFCGGENPPVAEKIADRVFKLKCKECGATIIISTIVTSVSPKKRGKLKEPPMRMIEDISKELFQWKLKEGEVLNCEGAEIENFVPGELEPVTIECATVLDPFDFPDIPFVEQLKVDNKEVLLELDFITKVESISVPESTQLATSSTKIPIGVKKMFSDIAKKTGTTPSALLREYMTAAAELGEIPSKEQIHDAVRTKKPMEAKKEGNK